MPTQRESFATYKSRKRFRKDLEQVGIKLPGAPKASSRILVNKEPLSSSLKHNDQQLLRMLRLAGEDKTAEEALGEEQAPGGKANDSEDAGQPPRHQKAQANLRELVSDMAEEARELSASLEEEQARSREWGDKSREEFDFLSNQAQLYMTLIGECPQCRSQSTANDLAELEGPGIARAQTDQLHPRGAPPSGKCCKDCIKPYTPGEGTIKPTEIIGEVERSEEAMDDAVVEYSRSAGLLARFRMSTVDTPVASGAFMRPSVPANNLLAARVGEQLAMVRNRMFRLDSMLKEGHSNELQVGRISAIMTWRRDLQHAHENMLKPVICVQSAQEMMDARMRFVSPASPSRRRSPSTRSLFRPGDADDSSSPAPSVRFDNVRPKTAGSPARLAVDFRPQTAGGRGKAKRM